MSLPPRFVAAAALISASLVHSVLAAESKVDPAQVSRGEQIFVQKCAMCHEVTGMGVPPVYPPLAGSDWLGGNRKRLIKVICEGLAGEIKVNGQAFNNIMPAQVLNDQEVADVLTYVGRSWGNNVAPFAAEEVAEARRDSRFATYEDLVKATAYQPIPAAPAGWQVKELVQLPEFCTRFASNGSSSTIYVLAQNGGIYSLDSATGGLLPIIKPGDYLQPSRGDLVALGATQDKAGRLWVVTNQRIKRPGELVANEVMIYRSKGQVDGHPTGLKPWFKTEYPYGVGPYNHGVSNMAFGPDGMLYVNSGSRTDGGESGTNSEYFTGGEVYTTACIWRLDPNAEDPRIEVFARGIRNAYGFTWNGDGQLFSVTNGPDADAPEEMDAVEQGKHYGFPFQFSDWPVKPGSPYPHTPVPPPDLQFTLPVLNLGPAAGGKTEGISTFDPHSSPAGMIWCGPETPAPFTNSFLITRFGNLLSTPEDVGFDVISAKLEKRADGRWTARTETVLAPLGRPLDIVHVPGGKILVLEYTRPTDFKNRLGWLPGRVLELSPKQ